MKFKIGRSSKIGPSWWRRLQIWWRMRQLEKAYVTLLTQLRPQRVAHAPSIFDRWVLRYYVPYFLWLTLSTTYEVAYPSPPPSLPAMVEEV